MKRSYKYFGMLAGILLLSACTKIDVPVENQLTPATFPTIDAQFILAAGPAYVSLRGSYCTSYWQQQTLSTDEAILPSRAGGWYDGGRYQQMHYHNWTADNPIVNDTWNWGFSTISTCNQILALFASSQNSPVKTRAAAEIRTLRALMFYFMMDAYGNIPVPTTFGDTAQPVQKSRSDVFNFIESEVKAVLPSLSTATDATQYGRPNTYTAYALLAKLYLNAEVYTGTPRYNDAVTYCDSVIQSGKYSLATDYAKMFYPDNGPQETEFIFAIPYDHAAAQGEQYNWYSLHPALQQKYGLSYRLSNPVSTIPSYYAYFNDSNDVRTSLWLIGKQYDFSGNPIVINTTKVGLDATYTGSDGTATVAYQLTFTPDVTLVNVAKFEAGGDELGKAKGIRNLKYYPDVTATDRNQSNDVAVFRYSDILLMKAEAILRGATPTYNATALSLVNQLRTTRKAAPMTTLSLDDMLAERARELNWELTRRIDLIRFGKYENSWGYKTDADRNKRIFPIPSAERILNPSLVQNPGY
ncbi:RagB/SusD family nutrient uptake outer membrane protein [Puia dinghuensis]|uniref:RagB/SusD family nutrient uptake outer membrane protein n=1 Tax=Puia dinghuensis TaxID=1792502 RepID=A0A8J2UE14_9BACT|nr:RagB/SusD family nutrient uptake outer membrane protein [Puia dinghuensis]GGB03446.1 hypothetical protein GCM10011511_28430 [Puia dinghuensis]